LMFQYLLLQFLLLDKSYNSNDLKQNQNY